VDVGVMSDRANLIFVICAVVVLMLLGNTIWLLGALAAVHRTLNFDRALRRELYPRLSA
jgi:hypothetical protein